MPNENLISLYSLEAREPWEKLLLDSINIKSVGIELIFFQSLKLGSRP